MSFNETVNSVLYRATGFRLTKETPGQHQREALEQETRHQRQLAQQKRRLEERRQVQRKEEAARRARGDHLPAHLDEAKRQVILKVSPRTRTGAPKLDLLVEAVRHVVRHRIPGDVVECGVWRGGSMQAVALTLMSVGDTSRDLHLFDTFEGTPPAGNTQVAADEQAVGGVDDVREGMAETGYPTDRVHVHVGTVEATTPGEAPETMAILRLGTDSYVSRRHELETLYERLSPGGILIVDDHSGGGEARRATDEWLETRDEVLFLAPMGSGRIAVRPMPNSRVELP